MALVLEVIACSVADAVEAERGGAGRLEIVRDLRCGGLTPTVELVREIREAVGLPVRVMLRESVGFQVSGPKEIDRLCRAAEGLASLEVDGVVLGFLNEGEIDVELTRRVLGCAPQLRATFHHAFEDARDKMRAISEIKRLPQVDRILSHGGTDNLELRVQRLAEYEQASAPELTIIAGGGIDADAIVAIKRETRIREFHVGRAARLDFQVDGPVRAFLVQRLVSTDCAD
ncbi:MAG TPA: copper homeostasis protein CutC [Pyrinomonadaceae bacterium]